MLSYLVAIACVLGIAIGQIFFKISSVGLLNSGTIFSLNTLGPLSVAVGLYGVTSLGWVWVLQHVELGRIYPLMALSFVLVPVGSYFIFGERFQIQYLFGISLIVTGIIVATSA